MCYLKTEANGRCSTKLALPVRFTDGVNQSHCEIRDKKTQVFHLQTPTPVV